YERANFIDIYEEISLYILFQGAIKSIELGNYGVTGLLVKRIATDFGAEAINEVFEKFLETQGEIKNLYQMFKDEFSYNDLITNFSFNKNKRAFDYCVQKFIFLLLGQEILITYKNLNSTKFYQSARTVIDLKHFSIDYLDYIVSKIKAVGKSYGLVYLEIDGFVDELSTFIKKHNMNRLNES